LDSGAGDGFLLDKAIGEAVGLHGTRRQRGFGAGPDSVVDEIVPDTALQVDKLRLPRQSIHLRALSGDACIFGTKLLDRFVAEIESGAALPASNACTRIETVSAGRLLDWFPLISLTAPRRNPPPSS
jgi:hypothetical protein